MSDIGNNILELREMDELAEMDSPIHGIHPLAKLIVTIIYIFIVASFSKYHLSGLVTMALYPAVLFAVSGISLKTCFYKLRIVLPLVCAVGIFNPFFDREILLYAGPVAITGGVVSMVTLMLKGVLCLTASFILAATTPIDAVCAALRKLYVPRLLTTLLLLTYRYISVLTEEAAAMTTAYRLRAPGQRGIHFSAWGSFLGQLLLRSMDRAEELHFSMQLRGFCGEFRYAEIRALKFSDVVFCAGCVLAFAVCRCVDVAGMIGSIFV